MGAVPKFKFTAALLLCVFMCVLVKSLEQKDSRLNAQLTRKAHGGDFGFDVTKENDDVDFDVTRVKRVAAVEFGVTRGKRVSTLDITSLGMIVQQQAAMIQLIQSDLAAAQNKIAALEGALNTSTKAVNQQAATTQRIHRELAAALSRIAALESAQNTKVSPVGFTVWFSHQLFRNGRLVSPQDILLFDHVLTNEGNAYSPQTGVFTAPRAGLYALFLHISSLPDTAGMVSVELFKNRHELARPNVNGLVEGNKGTLEVTVHLESGDQVYVKQDHGNSTLLARPCYFTGFLVEAD